MYTQWASIQKNESFVKFNVNVRAVRIYYLRNQISLTCLVQQDHFYLFKHQRALQSASVWWCVLSSCWKYPSVGSNLCSESSPASPSRTQPSPLARKVWRIPAGVVWGSGNGKCWFILKLFASLCIQLQSRRDVYHSPASQQASQPLIMRRFPTKLSGSPTSTSASYSYWS